MNFELEHFINRTFEHIHRVQKNMIYIMNHGGFELSELQTISLARNAANHDRSKFSREQYPGYVDLTWSKSERIDLTEEQKKRFDEAWKDHQLMEGHHPNTIKGLYKCGFLDAIEIACDLQAMAEEFHEGSGRNYFRETWKKNNMGYFYDDFNWVETCAVIEKCFTAFENRDEVY